MSPLVQAFIHSSLIPAVGVGLVALVVGTRPEPWKSRLQALAIALGFTYGNYILNGRLSWPPSDVNEALSYTALLLAGFVMIFPIHYGSPYWVRILVVLGLAALLLKFIGYNFKSELFVRNSLAFIFLGLGIWSIFERNIQKFKTPALIAIPMVVASSISFMLLFGASAVLAQTVGVLCSILGAMLALSLVMPNRVGTKGLVPFLSVFIIQFMLVGHFYLDINPWKLVVLALPYVLIWIRSWFGFIPSKPIIELVVFSSISIGSVAYFLWQSYLSAGPLY